MSVNPSTNWFWNDWDNDLALKLCSLAAQGLWMRMLSTASRAKGYVQVQGTACSPADIAELVGKPLAEVAPLVEELARRGVFSLTRNGTIYNRRMVRDEIRRETNRKNGVLGGNPTLLKQRRKFKSVIRNANPPPTEAPTPLTSLSPLVPKPQGEEEDSEASPLPAKGPAADPVKEVFDRGVAMLGKDRRSLLGKFCKSHGEVAVLEAIVACETEQPVDPVSFFVGCMSRAPPKNGHGKHPGTYRPGPGAALMEGAYNAAEEYIQRHGLSEGGVELDLAPPQPLLDCQRAGGDAPGSASRLARRRD